MKTFNHPLIAAFIFGLFIWFCVFCYAKGQFTVTVPKSKQDGYTKSEVAKMDAFVAFQIQQYDIVSLFGREGVQ